MSKHTPGPWSMCLSRSNAAFLVRDTENRLVCDMSWHSSSRQHYPLRDESAANARLIAAAPDLLSALNAMLTHMGMDEDEWNKPTFDQARAAIAKATGEQA